MSDDAIVIVGAGPAGLHCAEAYRESGGAAPVTLIGDDPNPPYERPALSKDFLRGESDLEGIALRDDAFFAGNEIDLRSGVRVTAIDPDSRSVTLEDGAELGYRSLVLATGSEPAVPDLAGVDGADVRTLRRLDDSARLRDSVAAGTRVLVVGSGFIGCEAAVSLAARGAEVTVATVEEVPQSERLGEEVGGRIRDWMQAAGVDVVGGVELERIEPGSPPVAQLGERRIEADLILLALGIRRNADLARAAGVKLDGDAIPTDERMRTAIEGVFAVGDVARADNPAAGRSLLVEHWGEAINHGSVAGATLAGDQAALWSAAPGFWSTIGERTLKQVAWGDGFDRVEVEDHSGGGFTARYGRGGELVGVLTHDADDDYERGRELVEARSRWR